MFREVINTAINSDVLRNTGYKPAEEIIKKASTPHQGDYSRTMTDVGNGVYRETGFHKGYALLDKVEAFRDSMKEITNSPGTTPEARELANTLHNKVGAIFRCD